MFMVMWDSYIILCDAICDAIPYMIIMVCIALDRYTYNIVLWPWIIINMVMVMGSPRASQARPARLGQPG